MGGKVVSQVVNYGDRPALERLIGPVKMLIDGLSRGPHRRGAPVQQPLHQHDEAGPDALDDDPDPADVDHSDGQEVVEQQANPVHTPGTTSTSRMRRPCSTSCWCATSRRFVYQAAADNIASEQSARMVAMKAASDNAQDIIDELQLIYNKNRQAAITKEISEIVGGAAAV